jgi:hypothetical protein
MQAMALLSQCWSSLVKMLPPTIRLPTLTAKVSSLAVRVLLNSSADAIGFHHEIC